MGSNVWDRAKGASANESGFDRGAALTRSLLGYGVLAGPFYLAVGLVQALVREGFDFSRHPLSLPTAPDRAKPCPATDRRKCGESCRGTEVGSKCNPSLGEARHLFLRYPQ